MPVNTVCTGCGKALSVADEHAGKRARCPACGQIYTVPLASPANSLGASNIPSASIFPDAAGVANSSYPIASQPAGHDPSQTPTQFWMRATDGAVYGPVDRDNLERWFKEGRVGIGYQIRSGETGPWLEAATFQPKIQPNPYAAPMATTAFGQPNGGLHRYSKPDRGALVLIMGILSFVVCGAFGIVAVVMGRSALRDIESGQANPDDKTLVQIGFWIGVANLTLHLLAIGGFLLLLAIGIISEAG